MRQPVIEKDLKIITAALENKVAPLTGAQVFLTGGTGFFGKWITDSFLHFNKTFSLDARLTIFSRNPGVFLASRPWLTNETALTFIQGDIRDFPFPAGRYGFIIHAATEASDRLEQGNPTQTQAAIVDGTRWVLEFAAQTGASRVMLISSGAVYGPQPTSLSHIPETYDGTPATAYGKGKKVSEQLCLEASANRFECVIARPFAFVGPYLPLDTHFAIGNFIQDCLEDRPIVIQGDGTPLRSYLYAADLAEWLWTILLRGGHARAYNVGSSDAISILDLAHRVRECAGTKNEIVVHGKKQQGAIPSRYVPCVDRAKTELPLCQRTSLSDAIQRTIDWHRNIRTKDS